MKRTYVLLQLTLLSIATAAWSFSPSGEAANPFNQFMSPSGGVSLFTGSAGFVRPLISLTTKGAVSLPINLGYSSNVHLNARSNNEMAPTGHCGLGWGFGFGKIVCNHHGTKAAMDDSYTWISPEGVPFPMYLKSGTFYIKDKPYWKVNKITSGDYISGWVVTDKSGQQYRYGHCNDPVLQPNNVNWTTLCWDNTGFVGAGFAGEPRPYPYQWDLAEIRDTEGNWIRCTYQKYNGDVSYSAWKPKHRHYTRESHIKHIVTDNGTVVDFHFGNKSSDEYYVRNKGVKNGPETAQPIYETKFLHQIVVRNSFSPLAYMKKITFDYTFLNAGKPKFKKRLLRKIIEQNGRSSYGTDAVIAEYNYYTDPNDAKGLYGALKSIVSSSGGKTIYEYGKEIISNRWRRGVHPGLFLEPPEIKVSTAADGEDFYVYGSKDKKRVCVMKWDGKNWDYNLFWLSEKMRGVYAAFNYFVVLYGSYMDVYYWNGEEWVKELAADDCKNVGTIQPSNGRFIAKSGSIIRTYVRNASTGSWDLSSLNVNDYQGTVHGENYIAFYDHNDKQREYYARLWKGDRWGNLQKIVYHQDALGKVYGGSDFFVDYYDIKDREWFAAYKFNGNQWEARCSGEGCDGRRIELDKTYVHILCGSDFYILNNTDRDGEKDSYIANWSGNLWVKTKSVDGGISLPIGNHSFVEKHSKHFVIWKWDSEDWTWKNGDYGSSIHIGSHYRLNIGNLFQIADFGAASRINIWNGEGWITEELVGEKIDPEQKPDMFKLTEVHSYCGQNSFARLCKSVSGSSSHYAIIFRRKYQDSFINDPYCYVVKRKIVESGVDDSRIVTSFSYETSTANYNATAGTAMFKKVIVVTPNGSSIINKFENDSPKLSGVSLKTESSNGKQESEYEIYHDPSWPANVYQQRVTKTTSTKDNVTTEQITGYNDANGMPNNVFVKNSDGTSKTTSAAFAFEIPAFSGMKDKNMLTQPYGSKTWYNESANISYIVGSSISIWTKYFVDAAERWRSIAGYTWRVPMDETGKPLDEDRYKYKEFKLNSTDNPNWVRTGRAMQFDQYGRAVETEDPTGLRAVTISGNQASRVIAQVQNASYGECAFFTCDYDDQDRYYFDKENGWYKGVIHDNGNGFNTIAKHIQHFGAKCLHVKNSYGPWKQVAQPDPDKEYIFSAWIRPVSGSPRMEVEVVNKGSQVRSVGKPASDLVDNWQMDKWHYVEHRVTPEDMKGIAKNDLSLRIWIGNYGERVPGRTIADFYIDDVRFYPSDAFAVTMFHDDDWRQVELSVDENNNPGNLVRYDGFGRKVQVEKVLDPSKSRNERFRGYY